MSVYRKDADIQIKATARRIGIMSRFDVVSSGNGKAYYYENKNIFGRIMLPIYENGYYLCEFHEYVEETDSFDHSEVTATLDIAEAEQALYEFAQKYLKKGQTAEKLINDYFEGKYEDK